MIKHINHQNVTTTPFVAAKARVLSNIQNDDTVILEPNAYANGTNVSLDYVDYNSGDPVINRECDIALEQQGLDSLGYEEGITGSAIFNSASAQNTDGTYKSLVHRQTRNAFYNTYHNPTEIFGVEHIDFPLSKTLRNLSSEFRMFTIPRLVFGDKIQPQSLKFYDTLLDDNVAIFDDGYQNLIAGYNLFSKVQEVRTLPSMSQLIITGSITSSCLCPTYDNKPITASVADSMSLFLGRPVGVTGGPSGSFRGGYTAEIPLIDPSGSIHMGFLSASIWNAPPFPEFPSVYMGFQYGSIDNYVTRVYFNASSIGFGGGFRFDVMVSTSVALDTHSIGVSFLSGSLYDVIVTISGSHDSHSITNVSFLSGTLFNVIVPISGSPESESVTRITYLSGTLFLMSIVTPNMQEANHSSHIGFNSGYLSP